MSASVPPAMRALVYAGPRAFSVKEVETPQPRDDEILLKVLACGVCGTDCHIHEGEFGAVFPLTPGHEVVGQIAALGKSVKGFNIGDRCVADNGIPCDNCFYCRRNYPLLCEAFLARGVHIAGGFAQYIIFKQNTVYKIHNLSDVEATLVEPLACTIHGADRLGMKVGSSVLIIGSGPTGLMLAQVLKLTGASHITLAANKGAKIEVAKSLDIADEYVELDRTNPEKQWQDLKKNHPYGFDCVVEATGVEKIANDALLYVRPGGKLLIYGVYEDKALVHWSPGYIFHNEITIIGSFAQTHCFPRAVHYLDSGKVKVKGIVSDTFKLEDYQKALDKLGSRQGVKIVITPQA